MTISEAIEQKQNIMSDLLTHIKPGDFWSFNAPESLDMTAYTHNNPVKFLRVPCMCQETKTQTRTIYQANMPNHNGLYPIIEIVVNRKNSKYTFDKSVISGCRIW